MQHEYFSGGVDAGLSIRPSDECVQRLKNFGLLVKTSADGLTIFKSQSADTIPAPVDMAFDFLVFSTDNRFYQYTALADKKNDEVYLFSNQTADNKSTAKLVTSVVPGVSFGANPGQPLLGVIRLLFNSRAPVQLTLNFSARSVKWRYYVVAGPSQANLVVDGTLSGVSFSRKGSVKKMPDSIISALTGNYPVATVSSFESDKAIALNSQGRKNIQLKNELSNMIIIKHLPNPALHDNGVQIINLLD